MLFIRSVWKWKPDALQLRGPKKEVLWDITRRLNVIMVIPGQVVVLRGQLLIPDDKMPGKQALRGEGYECCDARYHHIGLRCPQAKSVWVCGEQEVTEPK